MVSQGLPKVNADGVKIGGDAHTLMNESAVDKLPAYIAINNDSILNDSKNEGMDREVIIQELEKVLTEEFGYIVIE